MKNKFLIFLFLFLLLLLPTNNVFALNNVTGVQSFTINNNEMVDNANMIGFTGSSSYTMDVHVIDGYIHKYYIIYATMNRLATFDPYRFSINVGGGCNYSCFSNNYYIRYIGNVRGSDGYAIVLPLGKIDCGVGSGVCIIENNVTISSNSNFLMGILGVDATDDDSFISSNNSILLEMINSQSTNTTVLSNYINNTTNTIQQAINSAIQNTNSTNAKIDDLNGTMSSDTVDSTYQNDTLNNLNSQMASNSVISDLLLLPVRMYQKILDSLGSNSCVAYNLGSLYGTNLQFPCIQVQNYIGSSLWTTIDLIFCGMFILVIRKKFVDIFNNMTNLKDGGNEIE